MDMITELKRVYTSTLVSELRTSSKTDEPGSSSLNYYSMMYLDVIYALGDCTVNGLSGLLGVDKSTVSKKVDYLVQKGYAVKERDAKDGRVYHIRLSDTALERERIYDGPCRRAVERIRGELDEGEMEAFCKALSIFSEEYGRDAE